MTVYNLLNYKVWAVKSHAMIIKKKGGAGVITCEGHVKAKS